MKKLIILLLIIAGAHLAKSQQLPLYSQYMLNNFLLNPAIAGSVSYIPVQLTIRQQWVGMDGSPKTYALSSHALLRNRKMGVGGYVFNDSYGPISRTGLLGAYSYHLELSAIKSTLSLGLSVSAFQYKFDERELALTDINDPLITRSVESKIVPDACFGIYSYNDKYYVGFSAAQLIQFQVNLGENFTKENKLIRHYFLMGGYNLSLNRDFGLEPSVLLKTTKGSSQADINAKATFKNSYWVGISYRTSDAMVFFIGGKVKNIAFGYAYDYTLSNLNQYSSGSHEFMIGYHFKGPSRGSSLL